MNKSVLYITFTDFGDVSSGSGVRPYRVYHTFVNMGYDVKLLEGQQNLFKKRREKVTEISKWLDSNLVDFCYIELPTGPLFNRCDTQLIKKIHNKGIPIGIFYRDIYWKYPDWAWPDMNFVKKQMLIHMHERDLKLFSQNCDYFYMPSKECLEVLPQNIFAHTDTLPPGCVVAKQVRTEMKKKVFYVGATRSADGVDDALEALDKLNREGNRIELFLITKKSELDYLQRQDLLSADWLTVAEGSGEELNQYYEQCDLGILPRKRHFYMDMAISVKSFEFISHNLPILTTDVPAMARFVTENKCGIICKDNPESIKEALLRYYSDENAFKEMKRRTYEAAVNNTWEKRIEKISTDLMSLRS